ncbi:hypothetical protein BV25DRAFT_1827659 [Artomyces pyxidatus]|uniref:Uncharacterized protein n=1 Tax=Artomyces pyxidatus TaxID=48021 RepID=A0ACB8SWB8_9AGAM|nr:hypothetical protein BV25DRAFT_1827659 [Artomyces pyxidatus]
MSRARARPEVAGEHAGCAWFARCACGCVSALQPPSAGTSAPLQLSLLSSYLHHIAMKRSMTGGRAPSPTNTTYSGISNYRTDSYRPLKDRAAIASPALDPRLVARTHYEELSRYLASYLAKEPANSRSTARQKLTRLTRQQFQELSTDVYDELIRRKNNADSNDIPFLPVRDDFHPKRNQARQKLATLPTSRFKDLSSDVYYELVRRYPEFKEELPSDASLTSPGSTYDDFPSPDFPTSPRAKDPPPSFSSRPSLDRDRREDYDPPPPFDPQPSSSRRRPSQDTTTGAQDLGRRPSVTSASDSTSTANAQSATATSGMIIPNKSTIAEEDIEVPYGRAGRGVDRRGSESAAEEGDGDDGDGIEEEGGLSGLGGLARRLGRAEEEGEADSGIRSGGDEYFDKMSFGRASVASDRSGGARGGVGGRTSVGAGAEEEKMRRDYEYRIATMQSKIVGLEREVEDRGAWERKVEESDARVRLMEDELEELRRRAEEQSSAMLAMQRELADIRDDRDRIKEREARRAREDEEELAILRDRCERLEDERAAGVNQADADVVEQLRGDMEGLIAEVSDLSRRNDELMTSKDSDLIVIRDLDAQLKEYKRKYEQAKTELRSVKATSQLFLQKPKFDDQLPMSSDGVIPDVHVTAFLASIDALLSAARSPAPTRVLTPMKAVVNAVTAILEDVRSHPSASADTARAEATLGNLVTVARTHATSAGLAPVSILDAAASHVSAAITEIGRSVRIRRATKAEQESFASQGGNVGAGYAPNLKTVEETRSMGHQRGPSEASSMGRRSEDRPPPSMSPQGRPPSGRSDRFHSEPSSSDASSPPPTIFDHTAASAAAGVTSDDSAVAEGSEDAWTELKPYLEAQTESIVYAIQSVLSGVRSPTPSPTLNENLTQIITIVSSIVAVCHDNLPPSSARQGGDILRELSEHANKLSEMQALPEVTKESRQIMAKSSFAIANAMKGLQKL